MERSGDGPGFDILDGAPPDGDDAGGRDGVPGLGVPPPPSDPGGPERPRRPDGPPRRNIRVFLPWIVLGAFIIATERISMVVMNLPDQETVVYAIAASVFFTIAVGGSLVGGFFFLRAWHAHHGPDALG